MAEDPSALSDVPNVASPTILNLRTPTRVLTLTASPSRNLALLTSDRSITISSSATGDLPLNNL